MERKAASIWIGVRDSKNQRVEPAILDLATSYIFELGVINETETTGGHRWPAMLEVGTGISLDGIDIVPYTVHPPRQFAPNATIKYTHTVYIPREYAGMSGLVTVKVFDPFGEVLAEATKPFSIGHTISPDAVYEVSGGELAGVDLPYLNPDLDNSEGVVIGGVGSRPPPPPPPRPAPKKVSYGPSISGIDTRTKPEPKVEFEGEMPVDGRIG